MSVLFSVRKKRGRRQHRSEKTECCGAAVTSVYSYLPSNDTVVWNCFLDNSPISIAMYKETLDVWCNDSFIATDEEESDIITTLKFKLSHHNCAITIQNKVPQCDSDTKFSLTIDHETIPQTLLSTSVCPEHNSSEDNDEEKEDEDIS